MHQARAQSLPNLGPWLGLGLGIFKFGLARSDPDFVESPIGYSEGEGGKEDNPRAVQVDVVRAFRLRERERGVGRLGVR